jgi:hypothetical protein
LLWGVEEKTWPKFEVIWSNGLSPAYFLVNLSPELIFVDAYPLRNKIANEHGELKPVTGLRSHFGYMPGVLWARPGQNMKSIGILV